MVVIMYHLRKTVLSVIIVVVANANDYVPIVSDMLEEIQEYMYWSIVLYTKDKYTESWIGRKTNLLLDLTLVTQRLMKSLIIH